MNFYNPSNEEVLIDHLWICEDLIRKYCVFNFNWDNIEFWQSDIIENWLTPFPRNKFDFLLNRLNPFPSSRKIWDEMIFVNENLWLYKILVKRSGLFITIWNWIAWKIVKNGLEFKIELYNIHDVESQSINHKQLTWWAMIILQNNGLTMDDVINALEINLNAPFFSNDTEVISNYIKDIVGKITD